MAQRRAWRAASVVATIALVLSVTGTGMAVGPGGGGAPDPSFGGGDGTVDLPATTIPALGDANVSGVGVAPDGSIRVLWTPGSGSRVTKYSSTGILDASFGDAGTSMLDGDVSYDQRPAVGPDGSTYVTVPVGPPHILKLDPDGALDPTFGGDGRVDVVGMFEADVVLREGGGLLVPAAGDVVALTADGSVDPDFTYGTPTYAQHVALLADGRIAVASDAPLGSVIVLDADGSPASGIGPNPSAPGRLDTDITIHDDRVAGLVARPAGGLFAILGYVENGQPEVSGLSAVAFTATGARDQTVGVDGVIDLGLDGFASNSLFNLARPIVDLAGRLTIPLPTAIGDTQVLRFDAQGEPDPTFGMAGRWAVPDVRTGQMPIALGPNGGLYLSGETNNTRGWVMRLRADGSNSPGFSGDGFLPIGLPVEEAVEIRDAAAQSDGSTILLQAGAGGFHTHELMRLLPNGSPDPTFGSGGAAPIVARHDVGALAQLTVDDQDRVYVIHERVPHQWVVTRWLANGTPDPTWGDDVSQAALPFYEADLPFWFRLTPTADGGVMAAVGVLYPATATGGCCEPSFLTTVRLRSDGSPDPGYTMPKLGFDPEGQGGDVAFLPDGTTYIGNRSTVTRFIPNGLPDPAWTDYDVGDAAGCGVEYLAPWRRRGVLVMASHTCADPPAQTIVALDAHGHPDALLPTPRQLGSASGSMEVDLYERIVLGTGGSSSAVARLLPNGSPDPSFTTLVPDGVPVVDRVGRVVLWSNPAPGGRRVTRLLAGDPPAPLPVSLPAKPLSVLGTYVTATGDFDGDGTEDVLWYAPGPGADIIWYGRHLGGFTKQAVTINGTYEPVAGDFDGDGRTDLLLYGVGARPDVLWRSRAGGGFASSPTSINGTYVPVAGDFNGDRRGDIVWYAPGAGTDRLWSGRTDGGFTSTPLTINGTYQPVPGDYSGDGRTDLLFYGAGTAIDRLWTAKPGGGFSTSVITINGTYRPASGDLNGDGLDDVLWHGPGAAPDVLSLARHGGGFASQPLTVNGRYLPVVADVTGDGLSDVIWYAPGPTADYQATAAISSGP